MFFLNILIFNLIYYYKKIIPINIFYIFQIIYYITKLRPENYYQKVSSKIAFFSNQCPKLVSKSIDKNIPESNYPILLLKFVIEKWSPKFLRNIFPKIIILQSKYCSKLFPKINSSKLFPKLRFFKIAVQSFSSKLFLFLQICSGKLLPKTAPQN